MPSFRFPSQTVPRTQYTRQALTTSSVLLVLASTKATDIPNTLRSLEPEQQDTLMKYLYKGMAMQNDSSVEANSSVLLGWHEKVRAFIGVRFG